MEEKEKENDGGTSTITETETKNKTGYYPKWKVIIHDDDKTTMNFVVDILRMFFNKIGKDAEILMMKVHKEGCGLVGVYPKEQAEFRIDQTHSLARTQKFPLTLTMEKA